MKQQTKQQLMKAREKGSKVVDVLIFVGSIILSFAIICIWIYSAFASVELISHTVNLQSGLYFGGILIAISAGSLYFLEKVINTFLQAKAHFTNKQKEVLNE